MTQDKLVSIRLPKPLVDELKLTLHKNHYMTLSEAVRSIIRDNYLKATETKKAEIKPLEKMSQKELIEEIKKLRSEGKK